MIQKIEAYFMKELSEKAGRLAILSLLLFVPYYQFRMFFLFLLVVSSLPWDIQRRKMSSIAALPFSYGEIMMISYGFVVAIAMVTGLIGGAFFGMNWSGLGLNLLGTLTFVTAYYSIAMLSVISGLDNFGIPLLVFILDLIIGGVGNPWRNNPYFFVSPVHQGNAFLALGVALILFAIAYVLFVRKGVQK